MKMWKPRPVEDDKVRLGVVLALQDGDQYYGFSDHRGRKLPLGEWIEFSGSGRMIDGYGVQYPNGFHAKFLKPLWPNGKQPPSFEGNFFRFMEHRAKLWARFKHRKMLPLKEVKVELRSVTHIGEMVTGDSGDQGYGCVSQEMRILA